MSNVFMCSDHHYGHQNVIKYCNRPFSSAEEMDEVMIENWNKKIKPNDDVYHLGDFSFHSPWKSCQILDRLNGNKFLVEGNHDRKNLKDREFRNKFLWIRNLTEIKVGDQGIVLCHYAMRVRNKSHYGVWQLYGHSHGSLPDDINSLSMDVGVDTNNFYPYSFEEIQEKMKKKNFKPIDHHSGNKNKYNL